MEGGIFKCQQQASKGGIKLVISNWGGVRTRSGLGPKPLNEKGCGKEKQLHGFHGQKVRVSLSDKAMFYMMYG